MLGVHAAVALLMGWLLTSGEQSWWTACGIREEFARLVATLTRGARLVQAIATLAPGAINTSSCRNLDLAMRRPGDLRPDDVWRAPSAVRRGPPQLLRA
jgi:hypothetical protein